MSDNRNTPVQQPSLFSEASAIFVVKPSVKLPSYIKDHRKRFINVGADAVPDYELLELFLFLAIPRQDVKPRTRKLLETFGDFNGVLSATQAQLLDIEGVGASVAVELKIIEAAAHRLSRAKFIRKHVLSSWQALLEYCQATHANKKAEEFYKH